MYPKHTNEQLDSIGKHLLNAWSAEYSLRCTSIIDDAEYLKTAQNWTFPQAYYSALFSAKAVLLADGLVISNEDDVTATISLMATEGLYGPEHSAVYNPYNAMLDYRIKAEKTLPMVPDGISLDQFHEKLVGRVSEVALAHEGYILDAIGPKAYYILYNRVPEYLRGGFIQERINQLLLPLTA